MIDKIRDWLCPSVKLLAASREKVYELMDEGLSLKVTNSKLHSKLQKLEDILADKKSSEATIYNELAVSAHAVHRYKERINNKLTNADVSKMLYKALIRQLYTMDTLQDGRYSLFKGVVGVVKDKTLVTVLKG